MNEARSRRGGLAREGGRKAEVWAALWLMLHGWRILGFRLKSAGCEMDLVACRGDVLAVVEVKLRTTLEAAMEAVSAEQRARLWRAGQALQAGRKDLRGHSLRLDLLALAPGRLPRHIADAWG